MESLPYSVMKFLGVPVESGIMMIFSPVYIHPYCFALSANFSLNRLTDLYSLPKTSGRLSVELLKMLMTVVEV